MIDWALKLLHWRQNLKQQVGQVTLVQYFIAQKCLIIIFRASVTIKQKDLPI